MKKVDFTHRANTDLREIWQFTARRWNIDQADSYIGQILETCNSLAMGQLDGRDARNVQSGLRKQATGSHVVYFQESPDYILVIRILHKRMEAASHFED